MSKDKIEKIELYSPLYVVPGDPNGIVDKVLTLRIKTNETLNQVNSLTERVEDLEGQIRELNPGLPNTAEAMKLEDTHTIADEMAARSNYQLSLSTPSPPKPEDKYYYFKVADEFLKRYDLQLGVGNTYAGHLAILLEDEVRKALHPTKEEK